MYPFGDAACIALPIRLLCSVHHQTSSFS